MSHEMKPLGCDFARLRGLSEKPIVSHYENNYGPGFIILQNIAWSAVGRRLAALPAGSG